jgi:hypothetical protein
MTYITRSRGNVAAKILGAGTSANPISYGVTANLNGLGLWLKTSAASGDFRGAYIRAYFNGAGGGEAVRAYATTTAANVATGGTVNGIHASLSLNASSSISGQGFAGRFTLGAAADTRTLNGNTASLLVESDIATGNTAPATMALIRVAEIGAVATKKLFRLPTVASAGMLAAHTTDAMTHSVRCVDDAGTVFYLMATTTASNRTGGA